MFDSHSRLRGRRFTRRIALPLLFLLGCAQSGPTPDLGRLYDRAAQTHDDLRNPVILIPGLMGSRLVDPQSGQVIWGSFRGDYAHPDRPEDARRIALPMREGASLADLVPEVRTEGSIDRIRVRILGIPLSFSAYQDILGALGVGGYRSEDLARRGEVDYGGDHFTCFQFDYDWRVDLAENARRLHAFVLDRRAYVQREIERRYGIVGHDVHFDLVAHSMGGLLARYYLRYGDAPLGDEGPLPELDWAGARFVDRLVMVATPNAGAPQTLIDLVEGKDFGFLMPDYPAALLGTMTALYQLLPRVRHGMVVNGEGRPVDVLDPQTWIRSRWGLADPDQDEVLAALLPGVDDPAARRRIALDHLRKNLQRARRFAQALDRPAAAPASLQISLIAGDAFETPQRLRVDADTGRVEIAATAPGDGTVLRSSALMDERMGRAWTPELITPIDWRQVLFLFDDHLQLTRDAAFTDNLLYLLMEAPRRPPSSPRSR